MTIYEKAVSAISGLGLPYSESVYRVDTGQELPDKFLVLTLVSSTSEVAADNGEYARSYRVQISIFSRTGMQGLPDIDAAMVAAGFVRSSMRDLPYDTDTRHFGQGRDYVYLLDL